MSISLLTIYHHLPYPLRSLAASLRGYQLTRLRYGAGGEFSPEELYEHEHWTSVQWQVWREQRLALVLDHAARKVPYYRQQWAERRQRGDRASAQYLENWPVLSKEVLRQQPRAFLADGVDLRQQVVEHTSGTSGTPLTLWMSKQAVRGWFALFEARWRGWYGLSRRDRWGILGGQLVVPFAQTRPPFWVWNAGMHQLYCSAYHLAPQNVAAYLDAIRQHKLVYLLGYPSALHALAQMALEQKLPIPMLKAIISNAEPLYTHQRQVISQAFNCPVYDTYGQSENICAASECLHGRLHLWPELGQTEILRDEDDGAVPLGETGRLVCSGLLNLSMPLIRFSVGDRASLSPEPSCPCERTLPTLGSIDGRSDDVLLTRDGRRIGRLDPVFKADLPVREAQIIQETLERVTVRYVPAPGCTPEVLDGLATRLRERLGDVDVNFEAVTAIPRSANGKFKAVVSKCR